MLKLVIAFVPVEKTEEVITGCRKVGATGATVLQQARGEGLKPTKTFLGLDFTGTRDAIFLLCSESRTRDILNCIRDVGEFDEKPGSGIAFQLAVEDAVGLKTQMQNILESMEEHA